MVGCVACLTVSRMHQGEPLHARLVPRQRALKAFNALLKRSNVDASPQRKFFNVMFHFAPFSRSASSASVPS